MWKQARLSVLKQSRSDAKNTNIVTSISTQYINVMRLAVTKRLYILGLEQSMPVACIGLFATNDRLNVI